MREDGVPPTAFEGGWVSPSSLPFLSTNTSAIEMSRSANAGIHLGRRCQDVLQRIQIAPSGLAQIQMEENEVSSHGPRPPHEEPEAKRRRLQEGPKCSKCSDPVLHSIVRKDSQNKGCSYYKCDKCGHFGFLTETRIPGFAIYSMEHKCVHILEGPHGCRTSPG